MREQRRVLGVRTSSVLPHGGVGDWQRVVEEGDQSRLVGRSVTSPLYGREGGHHCVELSPEVLLGDVSTGVNVLALQLEQLSRVVVAVVELGIKLRPQMIDRSKAVVLSVVEDRRNEPVRQSTPRPLG